MKRLLRPRVAATRPQWAAVSGYDFFVPIVSGVDMSGLTARVPSWAWPLILISVTALFQFLRNLADRRHSAERDEASTVNRGA